MGILNLFKNKNSKEKNDKKTVVEASKEKTTDTPVKKEVKAAVKKEAIITPKDEVCIKNAISLSRGFKADKIKEYNEEDKCEIVVVAYDKSNKVYYYSTNGLKLNVGDVVIVNSLNYEKRAYVVLGNKSFNPADLLHELKNTLRVVKAYDGVIEDTVEEEIVPVKVVSQENKITEALAPVEEEPVVEETPAEEEPVVEETPAEEEQEAEDTPAEEEQEAEAEDDTDDDTEEEANESEENTSAQETASPENVEYDEETHLYRITTISKSFEARISLLDESVKTIYSDIKNELLAYGLKSRMSKTAEKFRMKNNTYVVIKPTSKALNIFFKLNPTSLVDTKYKGKDMSEKKSYEATPFKYNVKTLRKEKWALELIELMSKENNFIKQEIEKVNYAAMYPCKSIEELIEAGLVKKTIKETDVKPKGFVKFTVLQ